VQSDPRTTNLGKAVTKKPGLHFATRGRTGDPLYRDASGSGVSRRVKREGISGSLLGVPGKVEKAWWGHHRSYVDTLTSGFPVGDRRGKKGSMSSYVPRWLLA